MSNKETGGFTVGRFTVILGLALLAVTSAQAQRGSWRSEVGIQGGFSRFKPAGTAAKDHVDLFDVPGIGGTSLYAVVPWRERIAVEPSFSFTQGSYLFGFTLATIGVRGDYALTDKIYGAAGGLLQFSEATGSHESQLGLQVGIGYRLRLASGLNGRIEANWQTTHKAQLAQPANTYSLLFGLSSPMGPSSQAPGRASRAAQRAWEPMIGAQGGYTRVHVVGGGDFGFLSFPGFGGAAITTQLPGLAGNALIPTAPTVFAIIPVGTKLAVEPGLDLHRAQSQGLTIFSGNFSARLDYAVSGGWYAAAGGNLNWIKATKGFFSDPNKGSVSVTGANVAWGYRFRIGGAVGGRIEANYTMFKSNKDVGQATNAMGLVFGATMPLR